MAHFQYEDIIIVFARSMATQSYFEEIRQLFYRVSEHPVHLVPLFALCFQQV
jgi:uncharacterized protein YggT (Ycf19 family)